MQRRWMGGGITALLLSLFALATWAMPTATQDRLAGWQVVGQIGGPTSAVAVQGNYACVGVGLRLVVLDVSNPSTPTEVGATTLFPYFVEDVVISGTLAYVAAGGAGLRVVDVSDTANPVELGAWGSPGYAEGVAVSDNTVYLADGPYGLWTVDVSDPAHPTPLGAAYDMNYAFEVAVSGNHAYIAAAGAGLLVADVADPAHPVEASSLDTPGYAYGVAVVGNRAYIADAWAGLRVVDVSNPAQPVAMGVYDTPGWALNVAVAGTTVYVADGAFGLRIVDVSDPAHPGEIGALEGMGLARRVAVADSTAYVADLREGLRVVDVADPAHPTGVGRYSLLADSRRVAVAGSYAYVAAGFSGLRVVDVSDPVRPREVGAYDTAGGYAASVVISGTYVYLATYLSDSWGLHVVDVSTPTHPVRVSFFPTPFGAYREIVLVGQILYIADEWGLSLISVSDPTAPVQIGSIQLNQNQQDTIGVAVSEPLAYVADAHDGLKIVDVSSPFSPTLVGVYDPIHWVDSVAVAGNLAYVGDHGGLRIVDVSDPSTPVEIGSCDTPDIVNAVVISGTIAYLSASGAGMMAIEVFSPLTPTLVATFNTPGVVWHTALAGHHAYVADGHGGLLILERTAAGATGQPVVTPPALHLHRPAAFSGMGPAPGGPTRAASCVVTSTADSGAGTLRERLENVSSGDTVTFGPAVFPPAHPATITLISPLPWLTQSQVTIEASDAGVILDGSLTPPGTSGLVITSDGNVIRGLQILNFPSQGVSIGGGACYNLIGGDRTQGSGPLGQGNLLSGNGDAGIGIGGTGTMSNTVMGNLVGTDLTGTAIVSNGNGVSIGDGASYNIIGGAAPGERNVIGGSADNDVTIWGSGTDHNVVRNNLIGTDASGTFALRTSPPAQLWITGVHIHSGAHHNVIGPGNVINGCNNSGVQLYGAETDGNIIIGNLIGTNISGTAAIGNFGHGITLNSGPQRNVVGPANRIAYSRGSGVLVQGTATISNTITANAIHDNVGKGILNTDGGNRSFAAPVLSSVAVTTVLGTAPAHAVVEVFSDRGRQGQTYEGQTIADATGVFTFTKSTGLMGPHITATARDEAGNTSEFSAPWILSVITHIVTSTLDSGPGTLRQALFDARVGDVITFDPAVFPPTRPVTIALSSPLPPIVEGRITIDGSDAGVILDGRNLAGSASGLTVVSDYNTVRGLQVLYFSNCGVNVGGRYNVIGGDQAQGAGPTGQGNVVSGNQCGIYIGGEHNQVLGNLVGTDATGSTAMPNMIGVGLGGRNNRLGGPTPGERNIISGNWDKGVNLLGEDVTGNVVAGNYIGPDITGTKALGNGRGGVIIECGASGNTVGGPNPGDRNVISGNQMTGVMISDRNTRHNTVVGNFIGTDASGTAALGNHSGLFICDSGFNRVGGTLPGERNVISGNTGPAIQVPSWGSPHNLILGNYIGVDVSGTRALGNGVGVGVDGSGRLVFIGGATAKERNTIGGNTVGVDIVGAGVEYNWIAGNDVGVGSDGMTPLGNDWAGVLLHDHTSHNFVQGNRMAYNGQEAGAYYNSGVFVTQSTFNTIRRNSIHSNTGPGIILADGGNQMLPAPLITVVTPNAVSGTAGPGCTVEVFSDGEDEGRVYEGATVADASGAFTFRKPAGLTGPYVTATATDQDGNTSEFSTAQRVWRRVCLPLVLKEQ